MYEKSKKCGVDIDFAKLDEFRLTRKETKKKHVASFFNSGRLLQPVRGCLWRIERAVFDPHHQARANRLNVGYMLWKFLGQKGCKRWVAFLAVPKKPKWQINSYISSRPPASRGGDLLICNRAGTSGINNTGNIANMFDKILRTFRIRLHHKDFFARGIDS